MGLCHILADLLVPVAPQQVARIKIADRLREAVLTISQPELALIVGPPDVVGSLRDTLGAPGMSPSVTNSMTYQSMVAEYLSHRGSSWQIPTPMSTFKNI